MKKKKKKMSVALETVLGSVVVFGGGLFLPLPPLLCPRPLPSLFKVQL